MNLPGFTPGEKAQNAVVAAMYLVAIVAVVGVLMVSFGVPGFVSSGGDDAGRLAASNTSVKQTQVQSQSNGQGQTKDPGWVTVTSSGNSAGNGGDASSSSQPTQRIDSNQLQLQAFRKAMANASRAQLVSADVRQDEIYARYTQDNMTRAGAILGMGEVFGTYFGMVGAGSDIQAVHGRLVDDSGQTVYTYTINRKVAVQYNNGKITRSQLRQQLTESLHRTDQSPGTTALA